MREEAKQNKIAYSILGQRAQPPVIADLMHRALAQPGLLSLAAGFTDNETMPRAMIEEAVVQLGAQENNLEHLQYCSNQGRQGLIEALLHRLNHYQEEASTSVFSADQLMVTNGSQQALYLAMQTLCDAGDIVLVEEPSYFVFLELLRGLGIEAEPVPSLQPDALNAQFERMRKTGRLDRVKAVYLEGYFSNPSAYSLSTSEKASLAEAMQRHDVYVPVIEDAAYRELYFVQPHAVPSIYSLDAFVTLPKLYLGTLTKPFATGLKIGFAACSDADWRGKMLSVKGHQDFGSANFTQAILETVIKSGAYDMHLANIRAHYRQKALCMANILENSDLRQRGWSWSPPEGGLYYWLKGPEDVDTRMEHTLCKTCIDHGVLYVPGDLCKTVSGENNYIRLSFGALPMHKLQEATQRFVSVVSKR